MINLIVPKNFYLIPNLLENKPRVYFLAGPIRGAEDWQKNAIKMLSEKDPGCYVACPCRYDADHELVQFSLRDNMELNREKGINLPSLLPFESQTMWERYYLRLASFYGSIIFWLPCESQINPRRKEDGPYAQDTYGELGRWSINGSKCISLHNEGTGCARVNVAVGAEKGFPGLGVIKKNFDADYGFDFPISASLEEVIDAGILLAKKPISYYQDHFFDDDNK